MNLKLLSSLTLSRPSRLLDSMGKAVLNQLTMTPLLTLVRLAPLPRSSLRPPLSPPPHRRPATPVPHHRVPPPRDSGLRRCVGSHAQEDAGAGAGHARRRPDLRAVYRPLQAYGATPDPLASPFLGQQAILYQTCRPLTAPRRAQAVFWLTADFVNLLLVPNNYRFLVALAMGAPPRRPIAPYPHDPTPTTGMTRRHLGRPLLPHDDLRPGAPRPQPHSFLVDC